MKKELNIGFNKPYLSGKEVQYLQEAVATGHISGNGMFTKKCQHFFVNRWGFKKTLLTTSCTDALEMCALLLDIQPGDEVIMPSYTFVSTAVAFVRQGAKIIFVDSRADQPNIDEEAIEGLITPKTKAIVVVHYAGVACNMDKVMALAQQHNLFVVEDAAQAIDSYYTGKDGLKRPLGSIGHLGTFSFHETKNIQCGEGGLLAINDERFAARAEILWEKGTNRASFFRGEINKYGWVDTGSSFLPNELTASFLYAQLEQLDTIQNRRKQIWDWYQKHVQELWGKAYTFSTPVIPSYATNNAHMFYMVFEDPKERTRFIKDLKSRNINPVFHYQSLHQSEFYKSKHTGRVLLNSDRYTDCLVRLPFYLNLEQDLVYKK
ncbi:dTDP-4-amino-4,6-dideoxygalactose transaminase [Winogradskyella sp.]|nr:dTDP-4-amino-4,6-dideoxygalactose transaminase [Winogradskyella sp.]